MKHDKVTFIRVRDGREITADEAYNKDGILKSGVSMRTSLQFMDAVPKSGFYVADDGQVFKDGRPYKVPLQLCDDGVARPTLDRRRRKTTQYDPDGNVTSTHEEVEEDPETERIESDAGTLLADGTTVASHRPHAGVVDRATLEKLDAIRVTHDAIEGERWRGASSEVPVAAANDAQSVTDAYEEYDRAAQVAYLKGKG